MSKYLAYAPKLDSIRALAVTMVLLVHFLPDAGLQSIPHMEIGVDIFFTISGFLITSILLKTKEKSIEQKELSIVSNFIVRRALRLFPIYYLFLISLLVIRYITHVWLWNTGNGIYYFTYTANFLFHNEGKQSSLINHVWSLAVEEQFYLIWPWIVIFLNKKILKYVIFIFILCGLYFQAFQANNSPRMLPFGNFHTLGIGALLAYTYIYYLENKNLVYYIKNSAAFCATGALSYLLFSQLIDLKINYGVIFILGKEISLILFTSSLVLIALQQKSTDLFSRALNNSAVQYFGKISYGIYLYHKPIPFFTNLLLSKLHVALSPLILIIIYSVFTISISIFSYKYIEQYFLKLKSMFDK